MKRAPKPFVLLTVIISIVLAVLPVFLAQAPESKAETPLPAYPGHHLFELSTDRTSNESKSAVFPQPLEPTGISDKKKSFQKVIASIGIKEADVAKLKSAGVETFSDLRKKSNLLKTGGMGNLAKEDVEKLKRAGILSLLSNDDDLNASLNKELAKKGVHSVKELDQFLTKLPKDKLTEMFAGKLTKEKAERYRNRVHVIQNLTDLSARRKAVLQKTPRQLWEMPPGAEVAPAEVQPGVRPTDGPSQSSVEAVGAPPGTRPAGGSTGGAAADEVTPQPGTRPASPRAGEATCMYECDESTSLFSPAVYLLYLVDFTKKSFGTSLDSLGKINQRFQQKFEDLSISQDLSQHGSYVQYTNEVLENLIATLSAQPWPNLQIPEDEKAKRRRLIYKTFWPTPTAGHPYHQEPGMNPRVLVDLFDAYIRELGTTRKDVQFILNGTEELQQKFASDHDIKMTDLQTIAREVSQIDTIDIYKIKQVLFRAMSKKVEKAVLQECVAETEEATRHQFHKLYYQYRDDEISQLIQSRLPPADSKPTKAPATTKFDSELLKLKGQARRCIELGQDLDCPASSSFKDNAINPIYELFRFFADKFEGYTAGTAAKDFAASKLYTLKEELSRKEYSDLVLTEPAEPFTIGVSLGSALDGGEVTQAIRDEFAANRHDLTASLKLIVKEIEQSWELWDQGAKEPYLLRREGDKIAVYHGNDALRRAASQRAEHRIRTEDELDIQIQKLARRLVDLDLDNAEFRQDFDFEVQTRAEQLYRSVLSKAETGLLTQVRANLLAVALVKLSRFYRLLGLAEPPIPMDQITVNGRLTVVNKANINRLADYLHLDLSVDETNRTTPLSVAILRLQSFVEAVRIGKEKSATENQLHENTWRWLRSYGIWHAAMMVQMNPSNFMYSAFRGTRTPQFKLLEARLQDEHTGYDAGMAVEEYSGQLRRIARLGQIRPFVIGHKLVLLAPLANADSYYCSILDEAGGWGGWERLIAMRQLPDLIVNLDDSYGPVNPEVVFSDGYFHFFALARDKDSNSEKLFLYHASAKYDQKDGQCLSAGENTAWEKTDIELTNLPSRFKTAQLAFIDKGITNDSTTRKVLAVILARTQVTTERIYYRLLTLSGAAISKADSIPGLPGQDFDDTSDPFVKRVKTMRGGRNGLWLLEGFADGKNRVIRGSDHIFLRNLGDSITNHAIAEDVRSDFGEILTPEPILDVFYYSLRASGEYVLKQRDGLGARELGRVKDLRMFGVGGLGVQKSESGRIDPETGEPIFIVQPKTLIVIGGQLNASSQIDPFFKILGTSRVSRLTPYPGAFDFKAASEVVEDEEKKQLAQTKLGDVARIYLEEFYFHLPVLMGEHYNQKELYLESDKWLRRIYDPFRPTEQGRRIFPDLISPSEGFGSARMIGVWISNPFDPFGIAGVVRDSYLINVRFAIVDNLLDWADHLFVLDTVESINRARELYELAGTVLGMHDWPRDDCELDWHRFRGSPEVFTFVRNTLVPRFSEQAELILSRNTCETINAGAIKKLRSTSSIVQPFGSLVAYETALGVDDALEAEVLAALSEETVEGLEAVTIGEEIPKLKPFCLPLNPTLGLLRWRIQSNLEKIRTNRNFAGIQRLLQPYATPVDPKKLVKAAATGGVDFEEAIPSTPPPVYRYSFLLERAKYLVSVAQQLQGSMLSSIEKGEEADYSLMRAKQDVRLERANVALQTLRLKEASDSLRLAEKQKDRAQFSSNHFDGLLAGDISALEAASLLMMHYSIALPSGITTGSPTASGVTYSPSGMLQTMSNVFGTLASYERRRQEWEYQKGLADQDVAIADLGIDMARDHIGIVNQETDIAQTRSEFANDVVEILGNKFTNGDLYRWMSKTLHKLYREQLNMAIATAKAAQRALEFERQTSLDFIGYEYWDSQKKGLLGAEQLHKDLDKMEQYRLSTATRKKEIEKTISLASIAPAEFQLFRQTGVLEFSTLNRWFDRDFPGHYLRLIRNVSVTTLALVPPTESIHATLSHTGVSQVMAGPPFEKPYVIYRLPESVALSSPTKATGVFELRPDDPMLFPFEGSGVETSWRLEMPKGANRFDYNTILDLYLTIRYTALEDRSYREKVLAEMGQDEEGYVNTQSVRYFSLKRDFPDQWYLFHHPKQALDQGQQPYGMEIPLKSFDFLPNEDRRTIKKVTIAVQKSESQKPLPMSSADYQKQVVPLMLEFKPDGAGGSVKKNFEVRETHIPLEDFNGMKPYGTWTMSLNTGDTGHPLIFSVPPPTGTPQTKWLDDILFVVEYQAKVHYSR